jgi:hypothetical protein
MFHRTVVMMKTIMMTETRVGEERVRIKARVEGHRNDVKHLRTLAAKISMQMSCLKKQWN